MIIYKVTNRITGMVYIGQTGKTPEARWKAHCAARNNKISRSKLNQAINEFGKDAFTVEQIDVAETKDEANAKEMHWIKFYDSVANGYNTSLGGNASAHRTRVRAIEDDIEFATMTEAAKHYGVTLNAISQAVKYPHWVSAGQHWVTL